MSELHVSWDRYHRLIEQLAVQVWESDWDFDAIVCLARGGMRVGDVFSRLFRRPLGVLFTSSYRGDAGMTQGGLQIGESIGSVVPLPGSRWLLVDDLVDSGGTLERVVPVLRARHRQLTELRTAVLWTKDLSTWRADYCVELLPDNPWIHQPFEEYDRLSLPQLKARLG